MTEKLIEAAIIIALMAVAYILAIVIHEFGHLCIGALCGYSFVSFRIGPIEALYDTDLKDYLEKSKKNSLGSARVLYAYYILYAKDPVKADEERQRTDLNIRSVCPAEAKMEKKLIDMVQGESICNADCSVH